MVDVIEFSSFRSILLIDIRQISQATHLINLMWIENLVEDIMNM